MVPTLQAVQCLRSSEVSVPGLGAKRAANAELLRGIGERMRWIREAYEAAEPLRHSQAQWATALDLQASQLSRFENGKQMAPPDILIRLVFYSGASMDYLFFRVVSEEMMVPWLCHALLAAHPGQLLTTGAFLSDRDVKLRSAPIHRARKKRQRRLVKRKR
jgi:transcriptional regulator with XRE-family HTH domain